MVCMDAGSEKVGPYGDNVKDFARLRKIKIRLVVTSVDPKEKWRNEREIELSRGENLFEKLVRIEKLA